MRAQKRALKEAAVRKYGPIENINPSSLWGSVEDSRMGSLYAEKGSKVVTKSTI